MFNMVYCCSAFPRWWVRDGGEKRCAVLAAVLCYRPLAPLSISNIRLLQPGRTCDLWGWGLLEGGKTSGFRRPSRRSYPSARRNSLVLFAGVLWCARSQYVSHAYALSSSIRRSARRLSLARWCSFADLSYLYTAVRGHPGMKCSFFSDAIVVRRVALCVARIPSGDVPLQNFEAGTLAGLSSSSVCCSADMKRGVFTSSLKLVGVELS